MTTVLHPGDYGRVGYRIPVAVATRDAIVLFVEHKTIVNNDASGGVYAMRSIDGGITWSQLYPVVIGAGVQNVSPIYDPVLDVLHLAYGVNPGTDGAEAWRTHSIDGGISWGEMRVNVTSQVKASGVGQLVYGPNPGLRLSSGRLIVPRYHRPVGNSTAWVGCEYSDDGGATWTAATVDTGVTANGGAIEPAIVELPDGRLMMDCRHKSTTNSRRRTYSTDGGATWTAVETYTLQCGECQGSLVRVGHNVGLLLPGADGQRARLAFHPSTNGMFTTANRITVHASHAAYSSMVPLGDGSILAVYEAGDDVHTTNPITAANWAHDIRVSRIKSPWSAITNPNPNTDLFTKLGSTVTHFFSTDGGDERALFRDKQGTIPAPLTHGTNVSAVRNRGARASLWNRDEWPNLYLEDHPRLGLALRFQADQWRAQGGILIDTVERAQHVHQTGKFSIFVRFECKSPWPTVNLNQLLLDNSNYGVTDGFWLAVNYGHNVQMGIRAGGANRLSHIFATLGQLDADKQYGIALSCDGPGTPVVCSLENPDGTVRTESSPVLTGADVATMPGRLAIGNRSESFYCPFDGWMSELLIASPSGL